MILSREIPLQIFSISEFWKKPKGETGYECELKDIWEPGYNFGRWEKGDKTLWYKHPDGYNFGTYKGHYSTCPDGYVICGLFIYERDRELHYVTVGEGDPWTAGARYRIAYRKDDLYMIPQEVSSGEMSHPVSFGALTAIQAGKLFEYCRTDGRPFRCSCSNTLTEFDLCPDGIPYKDEILEELGYINVSDSLGRPHIFSVGRSYSPAKLVPDHPLKEFFGLDTDGLRRVVHEQLSLPYCKDEDIRLVRDPQNRYYLETGWFNCGVQPRKFGLMHSFSCNLRIPLSLGPDFIAAAKADNILEFNEDSFLGDTRTIDISKLHLRQTLHSPALVILADTDTGMQWRRWSEEETRKYKYVPMVALYSKDYPNGIFVYDSTAQYEVKEDKRKQKVKLGLQGITLPKGKWSDAAYIHYAELHRKAEAGEYIEIKRTKENLGIYILNPDYFGWVGYIHRWTSFNDFVTFITSLGIGEQVCNVIFVKSKFVTLQGFLENFSELPAQSYIKPLLILIAQAVLNTDIDKLRSQLLIEI